MNRIKDRILDDVVAIVEAVAVSSAILDHDG